MFFLRPGRGYSVLFSINDSTGARADADSTPSILWYVDGDASVTWNSQTITNISTGRYKVSGNAPMWLTPWAVVEFHATATVGGVTSEAVIGVAQVLSEDGAGLLFSPDYGAGTLQSATSTGAVLDAIESTDVDYTGWSIRITDGAGPGVGQVRTISSYTKATLTAVVDRAWTVTPDETSTYVLAPPTAAWTVNGKSGYSYDPSGGGDQPADGTQPERLETVYATDEDVALIAGDDYGALATRSLKLAEGDDGIFEPSQPWQLDSASVDFEGQGVASRHVILLYSPAANFGRIATGEAFAVQAVDGTTAYLRRLGEAPGVGQPCAPSTGLEEVRFAVLTFRNQIDRASYLANRLCGIDPDVDGRAPTDLTDLRELRDWTVLTVLKWAYTAAPKPEGSDFATKLALIATELAQVEARLRVRWGSGGKAEPPTGPTNARVRRA